MHDRSTIARRSLVVLLAAALFAGCRDRGAQPEVDSSLAGDLAMAQRSGVGPTVFNDAPAGGPAAAAPAQGAPSTRSEPPRTSSPRARPSPHSTSTPAPVSRAPRQPASVAQTPAAAPAPASAPAPAAGVIGAGTNVGMTTNGRVCTANLLVGDKFTATVTTATLGSNGASIPAGSTVVLEVASIDRADPVENSRVQFRVRAIDVNGTPRPAEGDVANLAAMEKVQGPAGNDRTKVIGGAVAGAVLGQIFGRSTKATVIGAAAGAAAGTAAAHASRGSDACLPEGSPLRFTLTRDIVVRQGAI